MLYKSGLSLAEELQREADKIYNLILHSDVDWIDIEIQISNLLFFDDAATTEKVELFDAIYGSRFVRLWEQWRLEGDTSWTWRDEPDEPFSIF